MSDKVPFWKYLTAGTVGGVAIVWVGQPLDTLKVRMQTGGDRFKGPWDCLMQTVRKEGPAALYKGVWSPTMGAAALFALCFASYGFGKKVVAGTDDVTNMKAHEIFAAGLFAGVLPTMVMTPMERVKVLLQTQYSSGGAKKYNGVMHCAKTIGFRSMYQGLMSTLYRDVPGSGFYYASYELWLKLLQKRGNKSRADLNLGHFIVAGGMAGVCGWCYMIFPDTIKSRIQASEPGTYRNFLHATKSAIRAEGWGVFFKGVGPIMARSFPANAACFAAYEYTMRLLNHLTDKKK